jgi:hypothetical protein
MLPVAFAHAKRIAITMTNMIVPAKTWPMLAPPLAALAEMGSSPIQNRPLCNEAGPFLLAGCGGRRSTSKPPPGGLAIARASQGGSGPPLFFGGTV